MAKITRKQVDDINTRLLNGWKFDTRHFILNGEKSVTMEIPLDEKYELSASISFYDSYECFEKIGTVVKIRVSKWKNIGNGMISSCDWGKSRAIAYTKPRKMFKDIEILTAFITKEDIMGIYNGTEETAEITNIRMNSKGLWERVRENSEPMPEAVAEITPEAGNLKPTKKRINALQQIVKANKEENRVAIQTEKAQFFGNGLMFVMLVASCFITPISEFFSNVADGFHHMARTFMNTAKAAEAETGEKLQLPTLQELREIKRVCKLNGGKSIVDFGEKMPCINADFLQKVLESLSGKVEAWKRGKYNIYLKDEYGNVSYIMGIQLKPEVKREFWKNTLERNRELEKQIQKKVYLVVKNGGFDNGIDDGMDFSDYNKAVKKGHEYLAEGWLGFAVFNTDTKKIEYIEGEFPVEEAFNVNILKLNGIDISRMENSIEEPKPLAENPTAEQAESKNQKGENIMNENKNNTMPNGNYLDINGKEITTGAVVEIRNAYFKADNGLYFVEHSPSDPTWSGTSHSLSKLCRNGKISVTKYSTTFYPLATFTNSREKRIEAAEHNSKYAEIEIVDFSNMENIIAHFNEELAQQRKTSQRNMWHYGENSDMCSRDKEIEEFLQSVIDRISGKSKIIDDNDITSMHNTENLAAETSVTEQPTTENPIEEPKTAWTGRTDYAERRAEKAERYAERAEKARATADRLQKPINDMHGDIAFFTQPNINTSAGRAFTNQRNRMFASFEKGFEERAKAEYYDTKSENLSKEPTAISSDDPEALRKLKDKLEKLTAEHEQHLSHNKALNKAIKDGTATRNSMGYYELNGKMSYFTTNETAEIRRLKDRIEELENLEVPENYSFDGGTVVFNTAENRVQILFDEIPDSETRENLKRNGFKWSPRQQAWQRMLNTTGIRTVKRLYPIPEKPTEENSVEVETANSIEETSQSTTENIVYPFILIDTPTAQPETAEEKTVEEQPTENPTVAQPVITFDETLLNKARQMYYKVYVDSISEDGINYIGSETEISGVRARIIPSDSWDDSITFYSAEKFAEYMNEELKLESEFWNDETTQPVEEQPAENPTVETPASYEKCERFIKEQLTEKGGMYTELFWDLAEKSGLWVRGTFGTPMSKALCNLTEVENVMQNGKIAYSVFKLKTPYHETPEEKSTFFNADLARFIASRTLAYDEREDMAYPLFEKGYTEKHKPSEKALFGYHLPETELYALAEKYHNGEGITVELAKKLLNHGEEEIEIAFDNGKITDKTYHFKKEMCRKLHTEYVENGVDCRFGESDRLITFEEIGKAFIEICRDEYNDILSWREQEDTTENQTAEPPIETITVEDTEIAVEKIPEVILEYKGDSEKLAILKDKALSLGATVSSTENHLTIDTYENHRPEIESVATELGLKTDEEMHKVFNAVQGKINEVGTIEQKNIIYKIPWGIYRRYSAEDITNVVLARTNDILAIKTENRFKAVSALIADNMEKSGMAAEQKAQAEIAMKRIDSPDKLNDYVCSTEENSADNSTANSNKATAERKIRPPPFLKDFPKIRKEKR